MILHFKTIAVNDSPLIEIWLGYEKNNDFFEFHIEFNFYKLNINLPTIRWFREV